MVLQAVVDDSGTGDPPVFVLAGFVATQEQWAAFADEWKSALDESPNVAYFKMSEAAGRSGEFARFELEERDRRVQSFVSVILRHDLLAIKHVVPFQAFANIFRGKLARHMDTPYFLSCFGIMGALIQYQYREHWHDKEPADFIFDEQGKQADAVQRAYLFARENAPQETKHLFGGRPIHRDDKMFLPLQSADLFAWHVRRFYFEQGRGKEFQSPAWTALQTIPCVTDVWDVVRLEKLLRGSKAILIDEGREFPHYPTKKKGR